MMMVGKRERNSHDHSMRLEREPNTRTRGNAYPAARVSSNHRPNQNCDVLLANTLLLKQAFRAEYRCSYFDKA